MTSHYMRAVSTSTSTLPSERRCLCMRLLMDARQLTWYGCVQLYASVLGIAGSVLSMLILVATN